MSITIKDCLKLPSLSLGKVIAGKNGLNSIVTSISVMEFADSYNSMPTPNELIITAFYSLRNDVTAQCETLHTLKSEGDVGLILFYSDIILNKINQKLINTANNLDFPIIMLPGKDIGLRYSDVISDVMEAIFIDKKNNDYFVSNTIERLSQLPESNRNITAVLNLASNYTKSSFFLCDENNKIISCQFWPSTAIIDFEVIKDAYAQNESNNNQIPTQSNGTSYTFYRKHFLDKKNTKLILYAATKNNKLNLTIMNETVEIIQLFSLLWNYNLNINEKKALIPALLNGNSDLINYITKLYRIDLSNYNSILFISIEDTKNKIIQDFLKECINIFNSYSINSIIDIYGKNVVAFFSYESTATIDQLIISELTTSIDKIDIPHTCTFFTNLKIVDESRSTYLSFTKGLAIAKKIYPFISQFTKDHIFFAERCNAILNSLNDEKSYYKNLLALITDNSDEFLLQTLTTYLLDADSEIKKTSQLLFVHRNTVLYRLNKVKNLLNCDTNKMPFAYDIYLAVALHRLMNTQ